MHSRAVVLCDYSGRRAHRCILGLKKCKTIFKFIVIDGSNTYPKVTFSVLSVHVNSYNHVETLVSPEFSTAVNNHVSSKNFLIECKYAIKFNQVGKKLYQKHHKMLHA